MLLERSSGISVPESEKEKFWLSQFLNQLTRSSRSFENPEIMMTTEYFERKNGFIKIPRLLHISNDDLEVVDHFTEGKDIDIQFTSKPRNDLQKQSIRYMIENDNGILKLNPGEGKTVISIAAICSLRKKAIILMHKDSLVSQWVERFLMFSTIKREDIGILTSAKIDEVLTKPIVIGTVQSMCSMIKKIPDIEDKIRSANFGIGVWDECHTTGGAPMFSLSCYYIPAKKRFGLSATPARSDHNDDVIGMHLGKVFEPVGTTNTLAPRIIMTYFDHGAMRNHSKYINYGFPMKDKNGNTIQPRYGFDQNRYKQMLDSKRNHIFVDTLKKIISFCYKKNRNILIICDRIKLLDKMAEGFPKEDVGFFLPRSGKTRDEQLHRRIVFSTPGSSRDGTDNVDLDCLILATPVGNLVQAIGRVCRFKENKSQPLVFDIVDTGVDSMVDWANSRKNQYMSKVETDNWKFEEKYLK